MSCRGRVRSPWLLALSLLLICPLAGAAEHGFYFGAGVNRTEIDEVAPGSLRTVEVDDTAWKAIGGFRPFDFLAAELAYADLGNGNRPFQTTGRVEAEARTLSASVIGLFPLPLVDLYGKAGIARWEMHETVVPGTTCPCTLIALPPRTNSGSDVAYGVGAQVKLKRLAVRLEYERFDIDNTDGAELYTLGFTWTL